MTEDGPPAGDVDGLVLGPMAELLPPPTHLRCGQGRIDQALAAYRRALARFPDEALRKGWEAALSGNAVWCWPAVGELVRSCERFAPRPRGGDDGGWAGRAQAMTDAYVKRFMATSAHARRCEAAPLREYARACAWVQAQYLLGRADVAHQSGVIFQLGEDAGEREAWFDAARRQAATGRIAVRVPHRLAEAWRAAGEPGRGRA